MAKRTSSRTDVRSKVLARIKRASELEQHQRMLIYGTSGVGKTRMVATAPDVLIIDVDEKGTGSTRRDTNPYVYQVSKWSDLIEVFWYLQEGDHPYKSVGIDGITAMQTLCLNFVLGDEASRDASRDPDMPSRQAWGKAGQLMKTQITNFRNLPMNVIFTALTRTKTVGDDEDDMGDTITGPACSPSVSGHLEAAVDTIGYLTTREVVVKKKDNTKHKVTRTRLLVGPSPRYVTKDRNGLFGEYVDQPNIAKMLQTIYDTEDTDG